jgi:hypothetical protein
MPGPLFVTPIANGATAAGVMQAAFHGVGVVVAKCLCLTRFCLNLRTKKVKNFLVGSFGLVGEKQVTRVFQ